MLQSLWGHRGLIALMARREVISRYKGSVFGVVWSLLHPMLMLTLYTLVFSVVFKARWGVGGEETKSQFAVLLFAGLIVHAVFAEVLNRAPSLIVGQVSYVKKIVFPLEIMPAVVLGGALFNMTISYLVLLVAVGILGMLTWTALYIPLLVLPLLVMTLGFGWFLASFAVFVRDVGQTIGILTTILLFASPVFYPAASIPEAIRPWMQINPLTFVIEQTRRVLFTHTAPDFGGLALYSVIALLVAWLGYFWFQKTRKGFADVL